MTDIPIDERQTFKQDIVGVNQNVELDYTLTAEQAEELILDMDQLKMDRALTPGQERLYAACQDRLASEPRPQDRERADMTVKEQHQELQAYIDLMRKKRSA